MQDKTLHKDMSAQEMKSLLSAHLEGQPTQAAGQIIAALDGTVMGEFDMAESPLEPGAVIDEGVRAGDPVLGIMIGLSRGLFRADKRIGAYVRYEGDVMTDVVTVVINPK